MIVGPLLKKGDLQMGPELGGQWASFSGTRCPVPFTTSAVSTCHQYACRVGKHTVSASRFFEILLVRLRHRSLAWLEPCWPSVRGGQPPDYPGHFSGGGAQEDPRWAGDGEMGYTWGDEQGVGMGLRSAVPRLALALMGMNN